MTSQDYKGVGFDSNLSFAQISPDLRTTTPLPQNTVPFSTLFGSTTLTDPYLTNLLNSYGQVISKDLIIAFNVPNNANQANFPTEFLPYLFFQQYSGSHRLPQTLSDFVSAYVDFYANQFKTADSHLVTGGIDLSLVANKLASFKSSIQTDILNIIKINLGANLQNHQSLHDSNDPDFIIQNDNYNTPAEANAFSALANNPNLNDTHILDEIATQSFNQFLSGFIYPAQGPITFNTTDFSSQSQPSDAISFDDQFSAYYARFATVSEDFLNVYTAFFTPGSNNANFTAQLASYIKQLMFPVTGSSAPFVPSQQLGQWFQNMQDRYQIALFGSTSTVSSVGSSSQKVAILLDIFKLVVEMIGTIQSATLAQSQNLNLLSSWQAAYSALEQELHTFTQSDGTWIGGISGTGASKERDNANQINSGYLSLMQAQSTQIQNTAKGQQSNINQSNDAVNQQADLATSIIQEFSTILGAIYK